MTIGIYAEWNRYTHMQAGTYRADELLADNVYFFFFGTAVQRFLLGALFRYTLRRNLPMAHKTRAYVSRDNRYSTLFYAVFVLEMKKRTSLQPSACPTTHCGSPIALYRML